MFNRALAFGSVGTWLRQRWFFDGFQNPPALVVRNSPKPPPQSHFPTQSSPAFAFEQRRRETVDTTLAQPSDRKRPAWPNGRFSRQ
jgi:hypothetical protein